MYIKRKISTNLLKLAKMYPVLFVTGPRQSGKSTLIKKVFNTHKYINLENPETKKIVQTDPSGFVRSLTSPTIIDEAQNVPDVFSALQTRVDEDQITGYFILTGSQNFMMSKKIKQSLAGRVAIAELLPCSFGEISETFPNMETIETMLNGSYPALYSKNIKSEIFYKNYLETYVKRDVTDIVDIRNISAFSKFVEICATRAGQLVNYAKMASLTGVSVQTVKSWLTILQQSYIVYLVSPYYTNLSKTLVKSPKIHFFDTGLLAYLLYVKNENYFFSQHKGAIFENFVMSEIVKHHYNNLDRLNLHFYRDDSKFEVDVYDEAGAKSIFAEIKASTTYDNKFSKTVKKIGDELKMPENCRCVIYAGKGRFNDAGIEVLGIEEFLKFIDK